MLVLNFFIFGMLLILVIISFVLKFTEIGESEYVEAFCILWQIVAYVVLVVMYFQVMQQV